MGINKNIQQAISDSGITKQHIAKKLNIKYETLRRKLNGQSDFTVSELVTLTEILNINIMEVFKNEKS
jgi:ribosome-binding protein aMBF1 (putative translation factor)